MKYHKKCNALAKIDDDCLDFYLLLVMHVWESECYKLFVSVYRNLLCLIGLVRSSTQALLIFNIDVELFSILHCVF